MKKETKKIMAVLMLLLVLINSLPLNAFAAFITDINSNAEFGVVGGSFAEYKHELHYANYDGGTYLLFCTQFGKKSPTGKAYEYGNEFLAEFKANRPEYQHMAEMIYFGYTMNYGMGLPGSYEAKVAAACTQQYVWETLGNAPARDSWNGSYMSSGLYASWPAQTEGYYNQYHSNVSFNGSTNKVAIGENTVLSDSNGVLAHYPSFSYNIGGVIFGHEQGSNDLGINVTSETTAENINFNTRDYGMYELMPNGASYNSGTMSNYVSFEFTSGTIQNMMFSNYIDPSTFSVSVEIESGKLQVRKINAYGNPVANCNFDLFSDEACTNKIGSSTSNENGELVFEKLKPGTYWVKETSVPTGYLLNTSIKSVNVISGQTATVEFKNNEPTGKIILHKESEYGDKLTGAIFSVKADEEIKNKAGSKIFYHKGQEVSQITTENGIAQIDNLPLGTYTIQEIQAPSGYLLNTKVYTVKLEYKDDKTPVVEITIESIIDNEPRGSIGIVKKDSKTGSVAQGDAKLKDAVYKLYANEDIYNVAKSVKFYSKGDLVATRTTNDKGECEDITELPLGKYLVKEDKAPIGYLIDKKEYEVNLVYKDQYTKVITGNANSTDKVKEMRIHIFKSGIKVNSGETPGLAGSIFTIKLNSDVQRAYEQGYTYEEVWSGIDEYGNKVEVDSKRVEQAQAIAPTYEAVETDKNGDAYTKELPYGTYIVKETTTPKDYESAEDFLFTITDDESEIVDIAKKVKHIVVNNEPLESYVKLVKKDFKTNKNVSLNSATFKIKATKDIYDRATKKIIWKKGEFITQKLGRTTYDSFTTNAKNIIVPDNSYNDKLDNLGSITVPLTLPVGSYEIEEIKTPPIKINLDEGFFNLMLEVLTQNETIELDDTNIGAKRLKDKLLKYPRTYKGEDDKNLVSIGFFPREASEMISQLLVWLAVHTDVNYQLSYYSQLAEKNESKKAKEE